MRRDKLNRVIKLIRMRTPKWFYRRCDECADDVKGEPMWYYKRYLSGHAGYPSLAYKTWVCVDCAPNKSDVIIAHSTYFNEHYGELDLSPLVDEETAKLVADRIGR